MNLEESRGWGSGSFISGVTAVVLYLFKCEVSDQELAMISHGFDWNENRAEESVL